MKRIALCFMAAALVSCKPELQSILVFDEVVDFKTSETSLISDKVVNVEYIPLELTENSRFGRVNKVVVENGLVYIWGYFQPKVVVYDLSGNVEFVLDKKGRGPGEYYEITNFAVDGENLYTVDLQQCRLHIYDCRTGSYKESKPLPFHVSSIEVLDNGDFLLAFIPGLMGLPNNLPPTRHLIFHTDSDFNIKESLLSYEEDYGEMGKLNYFTRADGKILFSSYLFDGYVEFDSKDGEHRIVAVNLEDSMPMKDRLDMEAWNSNPRQVIHDVPLKCDGYVMMAIAQSDYYHYFYDPDSGRFLHNSYEDAHNFVMPPISSYQDKFVSFLESYEYYESFVEHGGQRMSPECEERLKKGETVMVLSTMINRP